MSEPAPQGKIPGGHTAMSPPRTINVRRRYEISTYIGPCTEEAAEAFADAMMELPEFAANHGGAISIRRVAADDPHFVDAR